METGSEEGRAVLKITVPDPVLGQKLELAADLLTLSAAVLPAETVPEIARLFKVSLNADGFFQEAHVKLRPVDFAAEGVFLCGTAQYPKHIPETISQAYGAAGRAVSVSLGRLDRPPPESVCEVKETQLRLPAGPASRPAPMAPSSSIRRRKGKKARVEPILCKGDGLCNTKCPTGAIYLKHYTDEEIFAQIDKAIPATKRSSERNEIGTIEERR